VEKASLIKLFLKDGSRRSKRHENPKRQALFLGRVNRVSNSKKKNGVPSNEDVMQREEGERKGKMTEPKQALIKEIRSHEVAIAELNNLSSSRVAPLYYYYSSIFPFYHSTIQLALVFCYSLFFFFGLLNTK
jgi:hypothetical protein